MRLQLWLLAMSAALLQGCCFTSFSYFGASFGLETSLVGDTIQVHVYYRGISLPCSQSLDRICVALNCTKSRTQIVGDNNHIATWCLLDGEIIFHHNNTSLFYISPSGCCWSPLVGSQREAETLPFTFSLLADLRNRSDNVAINAPPQPPLLPVLRVPQNCTAKYNLTIYEKDGDILRCRYGQTARHECAHCTQLPFFMLDQEDESHDIFTNKIINRSRNTTLAEREQVAIPVTCKFQRLNNGSKETNLLKSTTQKIFGDYSFEIQFSKQYNSSRRTAKAHTPFEATNKDLLYISITVKSNVTTLSLYVESCQMSEYNASAGITLLQQGCLNNSTTKEHQTGNSKEKVYSIKLSSLPHHPTQVFVTCNVQLCTNAYNSTSCTLGCGSDNNSQMEHSDMQQVSAGPIHIKKESDSGPNYATITVGLALGGTVVYVVLILLKRSFVGLHYRGVTRHSARIRSF
ncbi:uncharacterized protein LOC109926728 [Rhincodon typus]|uniref:uncharacterized protein LOC109926728 n=1 Tax=Rhincodon typus TaxID=259920 RepID=UPI00202E0A8C|nr:uncharacterized protein LOC109926728 [Rhincodon typus]